MLPVSVSVPPIELTNGKKKFPMCFSLVACEINLSFSLTAREGKLIRDVSIDLIDWIYSRSVLKKT